MAINFESLEGGDVLARGLMAEHFGEDAVAADHRNVVGVSKGQEAMNVAFASLSREMMGSEARDIASEAGVFNFATLVAQGLAVATRGFSYIYRAPVTSNGSKALATA